MIPATTERVIRHTPSSVNAAIWQQTHESVARYAGATPQLLDQRLCELDREWDIERSTAAGTAVALLGGAGLAAAFGPAWLILEVLLAGFLLLHALVGWSPVFRLLGYRTALEIDHERFALKALRGDFQPLAVMTTPQDREDLARFEGEGGCAAEPPSHDAGNPAVVSEALRAARS